MLTRGAGRGLSAELIGKLESLVQGGRVPDTVVLLDMPPEIGMARARARGALDRFEQEEQAFFERVRQGYLDRAARFPDRYIVVDAAAGPERCPKISGGSNEKLVCR
jgi:dTMP kinase